MLKNKVCSEDEQRADSTPSLDGLILKFAYRYSMSQFTSLAYRKEAGPSGRKKVYSSKIIKAGALLADTKSLLYHWNLDSSVRTNLERIQLENIFGKASRSRVRDILPIFRQRYLSEQEVMRALVVLVKKHFPTTSLDRILYFHSMRTDRLLHDVVTEILSTMLTQGLIDVSVVEIQRTVGQWVKEGKTTTPWGEYTIHRVSQGILSTLRDFGVLQGAVNKQIAPAYLPLEAFAYVAFYLRRHQPSGAKLLELPDWKLFFLPREGVERFLIEAQQNNLLEYHAAGTVTRLTFPVNTLEEYANVLAQRQHRFSGK